MVGGAETFLRNFSNVADYLATYNAALTHQTGRCSNPVCFDKPEFVRESDIRMRMLAPGQSARFTLNLVSFCSLSSTFLLRCNTRYLLRVTLYPDRTLLLLQGTRP